MKFKNALAAGSALAMIVTGQVAFAEQNNGQTAAKSGSDTTEVSSIVVTATKRQTKLQETPIAISAFGQAQLTENHVNDVTDLSRFVPSVAFNSQGDQAAIMITMRGIGNDSAYTEVADPEVAMYVDGIYSPRAQGASVLMYDMSRVEVMRGPQGTLFGRNATVGAISLITAKPVIGNYYGNVEAVVGNYNRMGLRAMVNMPISDTFALRAAVITDRHDGYADFQTPPDVPGVNKSVFITGGKKYYAADQRSARISALWQPTDKFKWNLSIEGYQDTGAPVIGLMQTPRPGQKLWSTLSDTAPQQDRRSLALRSQIDYQINDAMALTYVAGASRIMGSTNTDTDAGTLPPTGPNTPGGAFQENHTVSSQYDFMSHEVQLKSTGKNTIDWIVGAYYSHEENQIRFDIDVRNGYRLGSFAWAGSFIQADREIDSLAGFAQATWHMNDRIRLTGGLRYTQDKKEDIGGRNVTFSGCPVGKDCSGGIWGAYKGVTGAQLVNLLPGYGISNNDVKGEWSKMTYLARIDADLIKDKLLAYGSIGTGFKSGNIEDGGLLAGPETLTNYEAGLKSTLWDGKATLNLAAYYEDFKGYQVNQAVTKRDSNGNIISTQMITQNAKGAKAYGFEAEFNARLTPLDRVQASLSIQNTEMQELLSIDGRLYSSSDIAHLQQLKGKELAHAPKYSGTISYDHKFVLKNGASLTPRGTVHFEGDSWLSYFNQGAYDKQKAYTRSDASLTYDEPNHRWSAEVFVQNIENGNIKTGAGSFGAPNTPVWLAVYQAPRTYGARLRASF